MAVLDDLHQFPNLSNVNDTVLNLYIRKAVTLITRYLNLATEPVSETDHWTNVITVTQPIDVAETYPDAVCDYVIICVNRQGNEGIKQGSQGSRSQTYGNDLPDSTVALLPLPSAVMLDTRRCYYD